MGDWLWLERSPSARSSSFCRVCQVSFTYCSEQRLRVKCEGATGKIQHKQMQNPVKIPSKLASSMWKLCPQVRWKLKVIRRELPEARTRSHETLVAKQCHLGGVQPH